MSDKAPFIHPLAKVETQDVGSGTRIWAYAHVLEGAKVGRDCNLGEQVFVENKVQIGHRCTIKNQVSLWDGVTLEDGVFVGPSVVFTNDFRPRSFLRSPLLPTLIQKGATLGANATIVCGIQVGAFAMVGAGCLVHRSVPSQALVVGNPMRVIGYVCLCGARLEDYPQTVFCGKCPLSDQAYLDGTKDFLTLN